MAEEIEEAAVPCYELAYVLRDREAEASLLALLAREGAQREREERLREIQLAYPIEKQQSGFFGSCRFRTAPGTIGILRSALKRERGILRFLLVSLEEERGPARAEPKVSPHVEPPQREAPQGELLTNEALEEKLSEILK